MVSQDKKKIFKIVAEKIQPYFKVSYDIKFSFKKKQKKRKTVNQSCKEVRLNIWVSLGESYF